MNLENSDFTAFANTLADEAKKITLSYFRKNIDHKKKSDESPVTIADKQTEQALRKLISERYPEHGIIGEELTNKVTKSKYQWIIDPIDGTKNFVAGMPLYGCLVAVLENGVPVVSIIDAPAQNERWVANYDKATIFTSNDEQIKLTTSDETKIKNTILCSTDYSMFSELENSQINSLRKSVSIIRYNGDCYLYGMLANGWIDIVLESDLKVYDFLALIPIVEQAGGIITDWQGNKLNKNSTGQVIACANATLHKKAIDIINNS